jgi:hypothetical protein
LGETTQHEASAEPEMDAPSDRAEIHIFLVAETVPDDLAGARQHGGHLVRSRNVRWIQRCTQRLRRRR